MIRLSRAWSRVTDINPYKVDFIVPENLPAGSYEAWAHNGHGGKFGWGALHAGAGGKTAPSHLVVRAARRWDGRRVDVKKFGAVGDGKTDDTAAVLKALAAANGNPRSTLLFPAGTYLLSKPIGPITGHDGSGIRLAGEGMGTMFVKGNPARLLVNLLVVEEDNVEIRGLTFDINELGEDEKLYRDADRPVHDPAFYVRQAEVRAQRDRETELRAVATQAC